MDKEIKRATKATNDLEKLCKNKAADRNQAYDRYGWDNTAESVCPIEMEAVRAIRTALQAMNQRAEPVAFLYRSDGGDEELILDCNGEHARHLLEGGWTETPLYK